MAEFAPIAQFIKSKRRKWPDQGKTGGDRKQERQDRVAKRYSRQNNSDYRMITQRTMAWLGTALKSSQPNRNASSRSGKPM